MIRRRSIRAFPMWLVLMFAPVLGLFWLGDYFPPILPFPGGVAALVLIAVVAYYASRWRRRLSPTPTSDLKERRCCVVGRLRRLEQELVSPHSGRACLAWLGFMGEPGDWPPVLGRSVPFVLEPNDGGRAIVIHLANGLGRRRRAWDHLGHAETRIRWASRLDGEERARALEFVLPAYIEQARADDLHRFDQRLSDNQISAQCEVAYEEGDEVVLEGRFRRVVDTAGLRSGDGLPTYEVVSRVILAKGPAEIHGRWNSPWMRVNVTPMLIGAICVEVLVHYVAFLLVHGVRW
jgi:hypothetical protein